MVAAVHVIAKLQAQAFARPKPDIRSHAIVEKVGMSIAKSQGVPRGQEGHHSFAAGEVILAVKGENADPPAKIAPGCKVAEFRPRRDPLVQESLPAGAEVKTGSRVAGRSNYAGSEEEITLRVVLGGSQTSRQRQEQNQGQERKELAANAIHVSSISPARVCLWPEAGSNELAKVVVLRVVEEVEAQSQILAAELGGQRGEGAGSIDAGNGSAVQRGIARSADYLHGNDLSRA